jgi:hypothetical protein
MRTIVHIVWPPLLGGLYLATWTTLLIASISAPASGSGPTAMGSCKCEPAAKVTYAPAQRRHLPAAKTHVFAPVAAIPGGHPMVHLSWVVSESSSADVLTPDPVHCAASPRAPPTV